jgi:hypothetical protein
LTSTSQDALRHISTGDGGVKEVASHKLFVVMLLKYVINNNSKVHQSSEVFQTSGQESAYKERRRENARLRLHCLFWNEYVTRQQ